MTASNRRDIRWGHPPGLVETGLVALRMSTGLLLAGAGALAGAARVAAARPARRRQVAARAVMTTLTGLGPTAQKAAQILATRRDLLPGWACDGMEQLWSRVPEIAAADSLRLVRSLPGFAATGHLELLGSGSIASVYRLDRDGSPVAVKVRRPSVETKIRRDLHAFAAAARLLARLPAFRGIPIEDMVVHMCDGVWGQVDLRAEADALHDLGRTLADLEHIRVPVPDPLAGSEDVLVMEFVGTEDAHAQRRVEPEVAARYILEAVYQMLFRSGLVHVDLHPGNLIVRSSGVTIVDAGFVVRLPDPIRRRFASFFLGLAMSDGERCAHAVQESAALVGPDFDQNAFERDVTHLIQRYARMRAREFSLIRFAGELFELQRRHSLFAESAFVFPLMSLLAVEGQVKRLDPDIDFQAVAIPYLLSAHVG